MLNFFHSTSSKIEPKEIVNSNKTSIIKEPELKDDVTNKPEFEEYIDQKKYHVIVGCFGNKKNASRLTNKLIKKGYDAFELDVHNNLHRIAIGSFKFKDDAIITLKKLNQRKNVFLDFDQVMISEDFKKAYQYFAGKCSKKNFLIEKLWWDYKNFNLNYQKNTS